MNNKYKTIAKVTLWILLGVSIVLTLLYYLQKGAQYSATEDFWTKIYLGWGYFVAALAVLMVIVLPFFTPSIGKRNAKKTIIILATIIVVVGLSWLLASDAPVKTSIETNVTPLTIKLSDAGLKLTYLLSAIAILSIIGGSVFSSAKK